MFCNNKNQNNFIPYGHQCIGQDDIKEAVKALKSSFITQGPKIKEFEDALCKYTKAKYAVAVSSGTAALHLACLAIGLNRGDEVITSPITFLASANCALYCGAKPVFADIEPDTANISIPEVKTKFNSKTKAVIPVHFAGFPVDIQRLQKVTKKHKAAIIEDAAHALGAEFKEITPSGKEKWAKVGSCLYSAMAIFSFHPVKSITTAEGGAVLTNSKALYEKLLLLRNHGITKDKRNFLSSGGLKYAGSWYYQMQHLGFNYRMSDIHAALGISQLKKLDKFISRRREIASYYRKKLKNMEEIIPPPQPENTRPAWHLYVIRLRGEAAAPKRKKVFEFLRQKNIGVQVHYIPVYWHPVYQKIGYKKGICPQAEKYYQQAFSLPLYPGLTLGQINKVISILKDAVRRFL